MSWRLPVNDQVPVKVRISPGVAGAATGVGGWPQAPARSTVTSASPRQKWPVDVLTGQRIRESPPQEDLQGGMPRPTETATGGAPMSDNNSAFPTVGTVDAAPRQQPTIRSQL
jgi:hypothetical protein